MEKDLTKVRLLDDSCKPYYEQKDFSDDCMSSCADIGVYFRDLETRLIKKIEKYDLVVGCVAWLTNKTILNALSRVNCSIVVQKEDLWRPDMMEVNSFKSDSYRMWRAGIKESYQAIKNKYSRFNFNDLCEMSFAADPEMHGVRCMGNYNVDRDPAFPRMHHKFLVFCKVNAELSQEFPDRIQALAVWTGSFNFTENGKRSFENAIFMENHDVAEAYLNEFQQVYALSEPLDWDSTWVAPQYRVGS